MPRHRGAEVAHRFGPRTSQGCAAGHAHETGSPRERLFILGLRCVGAWEEQNDDCIVQKELGCDEVIDFTSDVAVYYLIACWMTAAIAAMAWYAGSPLGRMTLAARDSESRAEYLGYNARVIRFAAFTAGGFFAGVAGGLFAVAYEFVGGEVITFATSRDVIIMAYIGGVGHFVGPIIGAVVLTLLQSLLSNYTEIWGLYVGIVFVGAVMFAPGGIAGVIAHHLPYLSADGIRRLAPPYAAFGASVITAALGVIGLLETVSFLNEAAVGEHRFKLFAFDVDAASRLTWATFLILIVGGTVAARKTLQTCRRAWHSLVMENAAV